MTRMIFGPSTGYLTFARRRGVAYNCPSMAAFMPPSSSVAVRRSIRWVPGPAAEPTDTVVLTGGKTGVFLDVRFVKGGCQLDWAFAGYRCQRLSFISCSDGAYCSHYYYASR